MIELRSVSKKYNLSKKNVVNALDDITITLPNKGLVFLIGESGSGKSTLLNLIGLLDKPTSGTILFNQKDTADLKGKEVDFFRNTYLGFIFQDYNLIEKLNVYQNIELSLDLQKKKYTKDEIDNILNKVGLNAYGKRKVNELSGGEKQRVAIARTLIKNPEVILADEPTGNLDTYNSEQIFNILKQIAEEKLVIVVTHNVDVANRLGDRIIKLSDGHIISDDGEYDEYDNFKDIKIIKSRLSFFKSLRLSFQNLRKRKFYLVIVTLIATVCLSTFGFVYLLTNFDLEKTHAETMVREGEKRIEIKKQVIGERFTDINPVISLKEEEIKKLEDDIEPDIVKVSKAVENNEYLKLDLINYPRDKKLMAYYAPFDDIVANFLEYSDELLDTLKLIGNKPTEAHEIVINKVTADYIIDHGIEILGTNEKNEVILEEYHPNSYEELIKDAKKIAFGTSYLTISGIVDEDMTKYDELKTTPYEEIDIKPTKLYQEFKNKYADRFNDVIVNTDFFETLNLSKNNILSYDFYRTIFYINDTPKYIPLTPNILDREIEIYDGTDIIKINDLQENEIIITDLLIDQLYDNEFGNMYMEYIKNNRDKITDINKVRNELLIKYVNDKNLIGQKLKMDIADLYGTYSKDEKKTYELVIKGAVVFDDLYFYVSNELLSGYMRNNSEVRKVYFDLDNKDDIMKTLKKYNNKEELYANTIFTDTINDVAKTVKYVSNIASKVLIGILIFTVIIFALFIVSSVNHNKKDIGILRAMGAKTSDIFKIYYLESFIIGLFAYLISIVVVYVSTYFANNLISENLFSKVEPIIFNYNLIYILIIFVILITLVAFVVPLIKITKTKPIDIIYNNK